MVVRWATVRGACLVVRENGSGLDVVPRLGAERPPTRTFFSVAELGLVPFLFAGTPPEVEARLLAVTDRRGMCLRLIDRETCELVGEGAMVSATRFPLGGQATVLGAEPDLGTVYTARCRLVRDEQTGLYHHEKGREWLDPDSPRHSVRRDPDRSVWRCRWDPERRVLHETRLPSPPTQRPFEAIILEGTVFVLPRLMCQAFGFVDGAWVACDWLSLDGRRSGPSCRRPSRGRLWHRDQFRRLRMTCGQGEATACHGIHRYYGEDVYACAPGQALLPIAVLEQCHGALLGSKVGAVAGPDVVRLVAAFADLPPPGQ